MHSRSLFHGYCCNSCHHFHFRWYYNCYPNDDYRYYFHHYNYEDYSINRNDKKYHSLYIHLDRNELHNIINHHRYYHCYTFQFCYYYDENDDDNLHR